MVWKGVTPGHKGKGIKELCKGEGLKSGYIVNELPPLETSRKLGQVWSTSLPSSLSLAHMLWCHHMPCPPPPSLRDVIFEWPLPVEVLTQKKLQKLKWVKQFRVGKTFCKTSDRLCGFCRRRLQKTLRKFPKVETKTSVIPIPDVSCKRGWKEND